MIFPVGISLERVVDTVAGFGVPGLVLFTATSVAGKTEAIALITALAGVGGPMGAVGGVAVSGAVLLISTGISRYGFEPIALAVIAKLSEGGKTKADALQEIEGYPISLEVGGLKLGDLKAKIIEAIRQIWPD